MAGTCSSSLGAVLNAASLLIRDEEIERRPYHRNCGCALHDSKSKGGKDKGKGGGVGSNLLCSWHRNNLSFPSTTHKKNYSSFSVVAAAAAPSSSQPSSADHMKVKRSLYQEEADYL